MKVKDLVDKLKRVNPESEVIVSVEDYEHDFESSLDEKATTIREYTKSKTVYIVGGRSRKNSEDIV